MDELLKKLLAAEILTEDTRAELETAFKKQLDEAAQVARQQATIEVTAQLEEQWITEREVLIEALDSKVSEILTDELSELKEDIERFRDLEAEYAEKLVEAKEEMSVQLKSDISTLIEKMDKFLEVRLVAEVEELREDIEEAKKQMLGRKIFEAFASEFKQFQLGEDETAGKLQEAEQRLRDAMTALEESEGRIAKMERASKLEKVLEPLSGRSREVMEAILKNVDTPMLEEAYKTYVGRVVKETAEVKEVTESKKTTSEKETKVLAEGKKTEKVVGIVKTGDEATIVEESANLEKENTGSPVISESERARLRRLAGIA